MKGDKIMAETKGSHAATQQRTREPQQSTKSEQQASKGIQTSDPEGARQSGLTRREPLGLMNRFADEMDRLFEDFGFGGGRLNSLSDLGTARLGGFQAGWERFSFIRVS